MQQRQLRLGDILDDYCPRERRLANHTIVAMVGDEIRLTRCTTCDTEHPYKGGKAPRLRKKKMPVVTAVAGNGEVVEPVTPNTPMTGILVNHGEPGTGESSASQQEAQPDVVAANPNGDAPETGPPAIEEVRLHRPLIRAQLPRIEREAAARPVPEFTVRQANKRPGRFQNSRPPRFAKSVGPSNRPGQSRGPGGPHGARQGGRPQGHGSSMRPQHGRPGPHPGKKRSR